jgi:hypothetical protein
MVNDFEYPTGLEVNKDQTGRSFNIKTFGSETPDKFPEAIEIWAQFNKVNFLGSQDLTVRSNRNQYKNSLGTLESSLSIFIDDMYKLHRKAICDGKLGTAQEEIKKAKRLHAALKRLLGRSPIYNTPRLLKMTFEATGEDEDSALVKSMTRPAKPTFAAGKKDKMVDEMEDGPDEAADDI